MTVDATAGRVGALAGRQPLDSAGRRALADRTLRRTAIALNDMRCVVRSASAEPSASRTG